MKLTAHQTVELLRLINEADSVELYFKRQMSRAEEAEITSTFNVRYFEVGVLDEAHPAGDTSIVII